ENRLPLFRKMLELLRAGMSFIARRHGMSDPVPPFPNEPKLDSSCVVGSPHKATVWAFYEDVWNKTDVSMLSKIFHADFAFRGSLGSVLTGHAAFAGYVRWLTGTLERYTCDILDMIEEGDRIAARMRFHGLHRKPLFGIPPTGRHVWWYGVAIFTFDGD